MLEYTIGIARDGGRPIRYLRIKSDAAIQVSDPVLSFTREQADKRSVYECIIGDMIRETQEGGFFYKWYKLESVLVETDHTARIAEKAEQNAANLDYVCMMAGVELPNMEGGIDDGAQPEI